MNLDGTQLAVGDRVYHRQSGQYGTVASIATNGAMARFPTIGAVYFDGGGHVGGSRQIGWHAPLEVWPAKTASTAARANLAALVSAAITLMENAR
ncbi:hypothetical protein J2W27_000353 [Variovorax boronicumulans]|uniref:hypothetical protein n=1 Tax=Variovorax boronicumulans TaxID=436515 RepID=UPI00277F59B4|nr:hypothetical protein [Variovorax boronicumulans]MDP9908260.1 hypothetical protein [Variovorax boronicumulans]